MKILSFSFRLVAATLPLPVLLACTDGLSSETGAVRLTLQQSSAAALTSQPFLVSSSGGGTIPIDPSIVGSLDLTVTRIQFLAEEAEDEADEAGWIELTLGSPVDLDLAALPTEGDSPLVIVAGDVPVGSYRKVRLFVENVSITFTEALSIGQAATFDADTPYDVDVPSAASSGIKTDLAFTVAADDTGNPTDVGLLFDSGASYQNVTATGNGRVLLAPVIKSR